MKYLVLTTLLFFSSAQGSIKPSGIETNGGDAIVAEAFKRTDILILGLKNRPPNSEEQTILRALTSLRQHVRITTKEHVMLEGQERDAININLPTPHIILSRASWLRLNDRQKDHLMMHELLPLAGFNDQDYRLSSVLMMKAGTASSDLRELLKKLYYCDTGAWITINHSDLALFRPFDMLALVKNSYCTTGLDVLVQAGWDINECAQDSDMTILKRLESESLTDHGRELERFEEFKKRVVNYGGKLICSPTRK